MRKKALLYILIAPLIYLYGLAENHFSFGNSIRGYSLEFTYEYLNAWRVLFGKEHKDNSVKVALYEYKLKAKKAKFDLDIALLLKQLYGASHIRFNKKERKLIYYRSSENGDTHLGITQISKDEFKIEYYNNTGWNRKRWLSSDYSLTKNQAIATIKTIKHKG